MRKPLKEFQQTPATYLMNGFSTNPNRKHRLRLHLQVTRNPIDPLKRTFYYLRSKDVIHEETPEEVLAEYYHMNDPLHRRASVTGKTHTGSGAHDDVVHVNPLARKTIQVAGMYIILFDFSATT